MRKLLFFISFISIIQAVQAQVGFSYLHSSSFPSFGVSTNPDKRVWGEARLGLERFWSGAEVEVMGFYNMIQQERFSLFTGLGFRLGSFEGVAIPVIGFQVKPIADLPNLYLHTEAMYLNGASADLFKGGIGIRYFLRPDKKGE